MPFTPEQLRELQRLLPWNDGSRLPDGRVLGRGRKDWGVTPADWRIQLLIDHLQPAGKRILELGSCEGVHTVQLAARCGEVVGLEARVGNVVCALVRLWASGVRNASILLGDVRAMNDTIGRFDIICHIGLLYHLEHPLEHLAFLPRLAHTLFLDTHYADTTLRFRQAELTWNGRRYPAYVYPERKHRTDPFSGMAHRSHWFARDVLLSVLRDTGYRGMEILDDRRERNGPRVTLIARTEA